MFLVVGTNHKSSPLTLREKISLSTSKEKEAILFLKEVLGIESGLLLFTCNRLEFYALSFREDLLYKVEEFFLKYFKLDKDTLSRYFYCYQDKEALRHLLYVICGLDSLVLGERQILGQVKNALNRSLKLGFSDKQLLKIFTASFSLAKKVFNHTNIGEGKVSVGSVAVDFIKNKLKNLKDKNIFILGVGKVTQLLTNYIKKEKLKVIFVSNRTYERAVSLAQQLQAEAVHFDEFKRYLGYADIIISATACPHFIIKRETLEGKITRPLLILDLAIPRDVSPEVGELPGVELYCLEDLHTVIEENRKRKEKEAKKAKLIIKSKLPQLCQKVLNWEQEKVLLP